jgi:membrane fusion protein (multidrug efflux system)
MTRTRSLASLIASLLATGLALSILGACNRKPAKTPPPPPHQVGVVTLAPRPVSLTTELPGRTTAYLIADVRPQVSGLIQKRDFTEGADIKAGQTLYQIDPAPYKASYDSALATLASDKAAVKTARAKSARYKPLAAAQAVSQQDYDDAVASTSEAAANILSARAGVESAKINLDYTRVKAPISGHIGRSTVTVGALVTANQATALATITDLDPIYVDVPQPATTLLRLKQELAAGKLQSAGPNQAKVTLKLEDGSPYAQSGKLLFSEVNVDQGTGSVVLRALFPNPDQLLLPGMFVREELKEGTDPNALLVPQQAVSRNQHGDPTVLLVGPNNKAVLKIIATSRAIGADWLVTSGLKPGDRVIVDGLSNLRPGMAVQPVDAATPPDGASSGGKSNSAPAGATH